MTDKFVMSTRQAAEFDHALERNKWTAADVKRASAGNFLDEVRDVLKGLAVITRLPEHFIDLDAQPFVPNGLELVKHYGGGMLTWDPDEVKLYLSPDQRIDRTIEGNELLRTLEGQPAYNANLLDYLRVPANQHLVPKEWRYVFFPRTIYRDSDGDLCIRSLLWVGSDGLDPRRGEWDYGWKKLKDSFDRRYGPIAVGRLATLETMGG